MGTCILKDSFKISFFEKFFSFCMKMWCNLISMETEEVLNNWEKLGSL